MTRNTWNALGVTLGLMLVLGLFPPELQSTYFFAAGVLYGAWWIALMDWMQARSPHRNN